jgi:hypothetical protein
MGSVARKRLADAPPGMGSRKAHQPDADRCWAILAEFPAVGGGMHAQRRTLASFSGDSGRHSGDFTSRSDDFTSRFDA